MPAQTLHRVIGQFCWPSGEDAGADGPKDPVRSRDMNGTRRADVKPGMTVRIVLKQDQATGKLTLGIVKDILTKSSTHPHGIKVRLQSGQVGRVKEILDGNDSQTQGL